MPEPIALTYRAFLSYAHADTRVVKRLHRQLETFRIDEDLIGRATAQGPIPKTLRPIFRDRDDFTAGHSLTDQTLAALDASAALVVLCSPASAKSHYVNEEIRLFRSRHPERPVIPVIADGKPGGGEQECFAPALRFAVTPDGTVTDIPQEELAADLRESGDGFDLAVAKVVARLIDLSTDEVFRRAERDRRRSARVRNGIIGALALLAAATAGSAAYAWQQLKTNEAFLEATLKRATNIVNTAVAQAEKYSVPRAATLEVLKTAEGLFDDMARLGRPTPELQRQKAWMLIQFARNYAILGDTEKRRARADEAHRILAALTDARGDDLSWGDLAVAHRERGDVLVVQGRLDEALAAFRDGLAIAKRLADGAPDNAEQQRALSLSYERVANVQVAQGQITAATESMIESVTIKLRLASAFPDDADLQRDVSLTIDRAGNLLLAGGQLDRALSTYRTSLRIRDRFAKADPGNADWQRGLSVSYDKIGDVLLRQRKADQALTSYQNSLAITERLAKADLSDTRAQRNLSVSHEKVGDVQAAKRQFDEAMTSYRNSHAIVERLVKADPANTGWQRDLAASHAKLARVYARTGKTEDALAEYRRGQAIMTRLVQLAPNHAEWRRDLESIEQRIAALARQPASNHRRTPAVDVGRSAGDVAPGIGGEE